MSAIHDQPPSFGHSIRKYFAFDPDYVNLNHGSYGSLPLPVITACEKLGREIEANPDRFMRFTYTPLLGTVRSRIANLIGAQADECVMVPNATHGVTTVLRNFDWSEGDILVGATTTYKAVSRTIEYIADISPQLCISTFPLHFPSSHATILADFRTHLRGLPRRQGQKIVAIVDSIVSNPGVRLPWEDMVRVCREENVWSVVDAAHSIGQQVDLNMKGPDPDFWISNCHKWLYAKRGCAVLYVPKRNQHIIKSTLPTSTYYKSPVDHPGGPVPPNFVAQFEWTGTHDPVPYLSVGHALEFRQWLGGEKEIDKYCHDLAMAGGKKLADLLGTRVMDETGEFTAHMVNVELPLQDIREGFETNMRIRHALIYEWNAYAAAFYHNGAWWIRCSAQIWNEISDFEYLAKALSIICKDVRDEKKNK